MICCWSEVTAQQASISASFPKHRLVLLSFFFFITDLLLRFCCLPFCVLWSELKDGHVVTSKRRRFSLDLGDWELNHRCGFFLGLLVHSVALSVYSLISHLARLHYTSIIGRACEILVVRSMSEGAFVIRSCRVSMIPLSRKKDCTIVLALALSRSLMVIECQMVLKSVGHIFVFFVPSVLIKTCRSLASHVVVKGFFCLYNNSSI